MARLFGTDGIRGLANEAPLTTELAFRLAGHLVAGCYTCADDDLLRAVYMLH